VGFPSHSSHNLEKPCACEGWVSRARGGTDGALRARFARFAVAVPLIPLSFPRVNHLDVINGRSVKGRR
jgi:hypothetical protein